MSDWYDIGIEKMMEDVVRRSGVSRKNVDKVYATLFNFGLIDYDTEKELVRENYSEEEIDD